MAKDKSSGNDCRRVDYGEVENYLYSRPQTLSRLEERFRNEILDDYERQELRDELLRLRREGDE